jgi:hypothetical protein
MDAENTTEILTVPISLRLAQIRVAFPVIHVRPCHSFPPLRPGFEPRSGHVGFVVDKVALEQVFSEYFGFPCQISFHRLLHADISSGAGTIDQIVADVPSGLSLTALQETKKLPLHVITVQEHFEIATSLHACLMNSKTLWKYVLIL